MKKIISELLFFLYTNNDLLNTSTITNKLYRSLEEEFLALLRYDPSLSGPGASGLASGEGLKRLKRLLLISIKFHKKRRNTKTTKIFAYNILTPFDQYN